MSGADDFNAEIERWVNQDAEQEAHDFQVRVGGMALERIVNLTPVDLGPLRSNWQVQGGSPNVPALERNVSASAVISEGKAALAQIPMGETAYIANSLPYATVVEFGGYPNPPKRGTYIRQKYLRARRRGKIKRGDLPAGSDPHYEIRSAGGFSKLAPQGMVRITAQELENYREG